jgi:hypothetical protein
MSARIVPGRQIDRAAGQRFPGCLTNLKSNPWRHGRHHSSECRLYVNMGNVLVLYVLIIKLHFMKCSQQYLCVCVCVCVCVQFNTCIDVCVQNEYFFYVLFNLFIFCLFSRQW